MTDVIPEQAEKTANARQTAGPALRLWPAVAIVTAQALAILVPRWLVPGSLTHFLCMIGAPLLASLLLALWWFAASRAPWRARWMGAALFVAMFFAAGFGVHQTMTAGVLFFALPAATIGTVVAMLLTTGLPWHRRRWILGTVVVVLFAVWTLVRMDGMDGSMAANFVWRWSPTAEQLFLDSAKDPIGATAASELEMPLAPAPEDWTGFRGPHRDGIARGVSFDTDWNEQPPRELWRRRVGPGWSSFCVVDQFAFTQEQQGDQESVVCYRVEDGQAVWVNHLAARFFEAVGGAGPRATPTYHAARLYTLGARGAVQCLDASTGKQIWQRDLAQDANATVPQWAFSSSPLVVDDVVVVFAGGPAGRAVMAYEQETGAVAWAAGEGKMSYSSPHLARYGEMDVILMATEIGLFALNPRDGDVLWQYDWPLPGMRVVQPALVGENQILLAGAYGGGSRLLDLTCEQERWNVSEQWSTKYLDPYFNDCVVHDGYAYGFSGKVFCCIDLQSGKRTWKGGRYGYGQILLLPDMDAMLIASEAGEAVLVAADPGEHRELGRFQAIHGKTWNHPVIVRDRLLLRNGEEAACFAL